MLHFWLNKGSLQQTKELHEILRDERTMKIIVNYMKEKEELSGRIGPARYKSSPHSKSSQTGQGQPEGKLELKPIVISEG